LPELIEVESARQLIEARALGRTIASVYAPDPWFLKRGLTPAAVEHALPGLQLVTARRRGKLLMLDTADPTRDGPVLALHLGMSGRVLIDGDAAGDPLLYASNAENPAWHRFGLRFADGGALYLRDPRRLGAVELDPDEDRLGPDALDLRLPELRRIVSRSRAPVKAVLMDQARIAGLGNLLVDEILWRAGIDPARPADTLDAEEQARLHRAIRTALRVMIRRGGSHTGDLMPARVPGGHCPRDGAPLLRRRIGGRTTFSCPVHQL
jgi:formamidopyrimidine-DNA glycosylase